MKKKVMSLDFFSFMVFVSSSFFITNFLTDKMNNQREVLKDNIMDNDYPFLSVYY